MIEKKPKSFYGYPVVAVAFLIELLAWGINFTYGIFFKPLIAEFGWSRAMTSGAYSLSAFTHGLLSIGTGKLTDRLGPRVVLTACGFAFGLGLILMSRVNAVWQLYLFYGLIAGAGLSGGSVPMLSTIARWFVKRRGLMTGIAKVGAGAGMLIMPLFVNWLISNYGWRLSYIAVGILGLVLAVLVAQFVKRDPGQVGQLPYGESKTEQESLNTQTAGISFQEAIYTRQYWMLIAMYFCFGFTLSTISVHIVPYAVDLGISATTAASFLAFIGAASIMGRMVIGSLSDIIGNKPATLISFASLAMALIWLQFAGEVRALYLFSAIYGFAHGALQVMESPLVGQLFGLRSHGAILGSVSFSSAIGSATGPALAGHIFDVTQSYHLAFLICIAVSLTAVMLSLLLQPPSKAVVEGI